MVSEPMLLRLPETPATLLYSGSFGSTLICPCAGSARTRAASAARTRHVLICSLLLEPISAMWSLLSLQCCWYVWKRRRNREDEMGDVQRRSVANDVRY